MNETILLIEDDASLRLSIQMALRREGFTVRIAKDGREGLAETFSARPDLILLDVMMPELNGFEVVKAVRERDSELPILMLTAKIEEADRVRGLSLGADDYILKPFGIAELLARVHAALRRTRVVRKALAVVRFGAVEVDFVAHRVTCEGRIVETTAVEMKLLRFFIENEDRLLSRARIIDAVWGADYFGTDRTVDNFVTRLRQKLDPHAGQHGHFSTVRGAGYRFSRAVTKP